MTSDAESVFQIFKPDYLRKMAYEPHIFPNSQAN